MFYNRRIKCLLSGAQRVLIPSPSHDFSHCLSILSWYSNIQDLIFKWRPQILKMSFEINLDTNPSRMKNPFLMYLLLTSFLLHRQSATHWAISPTAFAECHFIAQCLSRCFTHRCTGNVWLIHRRLFLTYYLFICCSSYSCIIISHHPSSSAHSSQQVSCFSTFNQPVLIAYLLTSIPSAVLVEVRGTGGKSLMPRPTLSPPGFVFTFKTVCLFPWRKTANVSQSGHIGSN